MPNRNQMHIDRALTNMSVAYMQDESVFIADKVFPIVPVQKQSDLYFEYNRDDFFRDEAAERAKGTESVGGDYNIEQSDPYFCRKHAFHTDINEEDIINADSPLQPRQDAAEFVSHKLLIRRENLWAQTYFAPKVWAKDIKGVDDSPSKEQCIKFNKPASDPIKVITDASIKMAEATGYKPNTLVLSPAVFYALKNHEDILDRIKYTQKGIVTEDLLATLFEVDRVLVPWAVYNNTAKGAKATKTDNQFIFGKHALLCYSESRPSIKKPSAGYIFAWTGLKGAGAFGNRINRFQMPWLGEGTERVEGEMAFDMKKVCGDLGIFFEGLVD